MTWDESNLQENEQIKAAFEHVKISEPKTPYHQSLELPGELVVDGRIE